MITHDNYRQYPATNWSSLKSLRTSPLQFKHDIDNPRKDQPHFRVGRLGHTIILEPHLVDKHYIRYEGRRQGKRWDAFQEEHADKQILNAQEWARAEGFARAILSHPAAMSHLRAPIEIEVPLTWTDIETGITCKGRLDVIGRTVVDIKSSANLNERRFPTTVAQFGYHGQLAFYHDGATENGYDLTEDPVLIVADSNPPHDVLVYRLPDHVMNAGRELYRSLLRTYADCMERDHWPGQAPYELELELPAWAYRDGDDDMMPALTIGGVAMGDA